MKISDLVSAFRNFADTPESHTDIAPRPRTPASARAAAQHDAREDRIVLSAEAVFRFAASQYDPRRIRHDSVHALAGILHDGGAIGDRDHSILTAPPARDAGGTRPDRDLVQEFQARLSQGIARADTPAVEESTRALAILGRLNSIRAEIFASDDA